MKVFQICFVLGALLLVSENAFAKLNVFACEPEWAALAKELGGDNVKATSATTAMQDPHHIQARPSLISRASKADLLVCTGAELEVGWLPVLQQKASNEKILPGNPGYFMATEYVDLLEIPDRLDRSKGDVHAAGNPHIQTDPRRIGQVAEVLSERLAELDPTHASDYAERYKEFSTRWSESIAKWEAKANTLRGRNIVVQHKNWVYLEDWLGLSELTALEPKPGVPPSAARLAKVLSKVKDNPVLAVVHAAYQNPKAANWLAKKAALPVVNLPFTVGGSDAASDLFGLFDDTVEKLTGAATR
ncbi:MAG: metal ABC transporter substrate-binding protein [bacterium]